MNKISFKNKIIYVSNSDFSSNEANVIQVINQCLGFSFKEIDIILIGSTSKGKDNAKLNLTEKFGSIFYHKSSKIFKFIFIDNFLLRLFRRELTIALLTMVYLFKFKLINKSNIFYSRNLFFSYLFSFFKEFRRSICYEHHFIEHKFYRVIMQKRVAKVLKSIYISHALKSKIDVNNNGLVLHDCGPSSKLFDIYKQYKDVKIKKKIKQNSYFNVGYFGTFRKGSGAYLILELAKLLENSNILFHIFGKIETNIINNNLPNNIKIWGIIDYKNIFTTMGLMDTLLMPYQKKIVVADNIDTAKVMSPLKLFEYFSTGVPVISSNLSILREVMNNGKDCILVDPEDALKWKEQIMRLKDNKKLCNSISNQAKKLVKDNFNWENRANSIIRYINDI